MEELVGHPYEMAKLLLCHTDEMLSPTYDIATALMSYGRVIKSSVRDNMMLKKYGVALLRRRTSQLTSLQSSTNSNMGQIQYKINTPSYQKIRS